MSFLIIDAPVDESLPHYITELHKYNTKHLVRACEVDYNASPLVEAGIEIHDLPFKDGEPPPQEVIDEWLGLVDKVFDVGRVKKKKSRKGAPKSKEEFCFLAQGDTSFANQKVFRCNPRLASCPPLHKFRWANHVSSELDRNRYRTDTK